MKFEVFHLGLLGRTDVIAVDMIHYSGLWGPCFSHHLPNNNHPCYAADTSTEGILRFLSCESLAPLVGYTITTHHFDADALLPVWSFLNPDTALANQDLITRIARCGDFFIYIDDASAKLNFIIEETHHRLRRAGARGERLVDDALTRACFDALMPGWTDLMRDPSLAEDVWSEPMRVMQADLDYLTAAGRVCELWDCHSSLVEADHELDAHALNTACRNDVLLVWRTDGAPPTIDVRPAIAWYDLRSLPHRPRYDLDELVKRLNVAEAQTGAMAPVWHHEVGPAWVRTTQSRLSQAQLLDVVAAWMDHEPDARVSAAYRADVRHTHSHLPKHVIYTSHRRFADARQLSYAPNQPYDGLHQLIAQTQAAASNPMAASAPTSSHAFLVADDFYWNRQMPEPLQLCAIVETSAPEIWLEYDAWEDATKPVRPVQFTRADGRCELVFAIDDARFGNSQDWADFRLRCERGRDLRVRSLTLSKLGAGP